jgi:hypothetical protein
MKQNYKTLLTSININIIFISRVNCSIANINKHANTVGKTASPSVFTSRSRNDLSGGYIMNPNWKDNLTPFEVKYPIQVLNYVYKDSTIYLPRKYATWQYILNSDSNILSSNYGKKSGCYNTWSSPMRTDA